MGYAQLFSRAERGLEAPLVTVEVHLAGGLPMFNIVGLAATAVRESRDRVRGALATCQYDFPVSRIVVNLAPADIPKHGGRFDLAIALGILAASDQLPAKKLAQYEVFGELSLSGRLCAVSGLLPACLQTYAAGRTALVAAGNAVEARLPESSSVITAPTLSDMVQFLVGGQMPPGNTADTASEPMARNDASRGPDHEGDSDRSEFVFGDIADVRGHQHAKRALQIAATGGHNLLLSGPPGTGKSLLASRLGSLMPPMRREEAMQTACIDSLLGGIVHTDLRALHQRPFRSPHHSASAPALIGGGSHPRPGEISRAHNGVLFLDELAEFPRHVLETLREPLETGEVHIARAQLQVTFPARFQLVAAMNPCPCGFLGDPVRTCRCSAEQVQKYRSKLSGPLMDRIDIAVDVPRVAFSALSAQPSGPDSATVRKAVTIARALAIERQGCANAALSANVLSEWLREGGEAVALLESAAGKFALSARHCHRLLRVSRSIADLAGCEGIEKTHMAEALALRVDVKD